MYNIVLDKVKIRDNRQLLNKGEIEEIIDKKPIGYKATCVLDIYN